MQLLSLNPDQQREAINTRQRFAAWREALLRQREGRGSMTWSRTKGRDYLLRSAYDRTGRRRQVSLGPRSAGTERIKADFEAARERDEARIAALRPVMARQAAVNRALGLGRVPVIGARILRALDAAGLLGQGLRVVGTNAIYAYEAVAGITVDAALLATEDIDLLFDARARLAFVADGDVEPGSLLRLLQRVDRSFERTRQAFRAANGDGYLVDLVKPLRSPPWSSEETRLGDDPADLDAVEIAGLQWLESAPAFEATAIDQRGEPLHLVTVDPRVFAAHKHWLAGQPDREPLRRRRDAAQAAAVASLTATHLGHLPFEADALRMLPAPVFAAARALFAFDQQA